MAALKEYLDDQRRSPFGGWFGGLAVPAALAVTVGLRRVSGDGAGLKAVGQGVQALRVEGGLTVYLAADGAATLILLGGASAARAAASVAAAQACWKTYRAAATKRRRAAR